MQLLKNIVSTLTARQRVLFVALCVWMIAVSALDVASIAIVLPYLRLLSAPDLVERDLARWNMRVPEWCETPDRLLIAGTSVVLVFFVIKGLMTTQMWRAVYRFLYGNSAQQAQVLFTHYLKRPFEDHLQSSPSDLIRSVADDVSNAFTSYLYAWMTLLSEAMVAAGLVAVLLIVAPLASLVSLIVLGGGCALSLHWMRHAITRAGESHVAERGNVLQCLSHGIGGIKEIQIWQMADRVGDRLGAGCRKWSDAQRLEIELRLLPRTFGEALLILGALICVLVLVFGTSEYSRYLPTLALFAISSFRILPMLTTLTNVVNKLRFHAPGAQRAIVQLRAAHEFAMSRRPPQNDAPSRPSLHFTKRLDLCDVCYSYPQSGVAVLQDVSLSIATRDSVAIVGASGAGKTTLINLILGLLQPTRGEIRVDGLSIHQNVESWQRQIAYIPQDVYLFEDTIRNNLQMGIAGDSDDAALWRALEQAQLAEFVRALPCGLETPLSDRGANLSGGQRQRLGIARALYRDPAVLVFDEATSALDRDTEAQLATAIAQLLGQKTIILITHRLEIAGLCERVVALDRGRVQADDAGHSHRRSPARHPRSTEPIPASL